MESVARDGDDADDPLDDSDLAELDPKLAAHMIEVEHALVRSRTDQATASALARKHRVSMRTATNWVALVRAQWAKESRSSAHRELGRDHARATLNACVTLCLERTVAVTDSDGQPIMTPARDVDGRPMLVPMIGTDGLPVFDGQGSTVMVPMQVPLVNAHPDVRTALRAVAQLRALDGLDQPTKHQLTIKNEWENMSDEELAKIANSANSVVARSDARQIAAAKNGNGSGSSNGGVNGPARS